MSCDFWILKACRTEACYGNGPVNFYGKPIGLCLAKLVLFQNQFPHFYSFSEISLHLVILPKIISVLDFVTTPQLVLIL